MKRVSRSYLRVAACLGLAAFAMTAFAACGDEEEQALTYTLSGNGKAAELSGPGSADSGLAEISFDNESDGDGDLQLVRVEGDQTAEQAIEGLEAASSEKPFPEWFFAGGGPGAVGPGESGTVTQVLVPGTYYAIEVEGDLDPKAAIALEVSGDVPDEELEADATVEAFDYGFETEGIVDGQNEVVFTNTGDQPHHIVYAPLQGDSTAEDVEAFLKTEKGKPPIDDKKVRSTAVIEGGEEQLVSMELEPGRYALLCFISDRQGGPPHIAKGMIGEVEVE